MNPEIARFNKAVKEDPELLKVVTEKGSDVEAIVAYANSQGYKFTVDDLDLNKDTSGELSSDELDNVAGGMVGIIIIQPVTAVGIVVVAGA